MKFSRPKLTINNSFEYLQSFIQKFLGSFGRDGRKFSLVIEIFEGHCSCEGKPVNSKMRSSWLPSLLPGNNGALWNISKMMQAALQTSTLLVYGILRRISGARYHNVTTTLVSRISRSYVLAKPKSAIFRSSFEEMSKFWGFKSRWMIRWEWRKSIPVKSSCESRWRVVAGKPPTRDARKPARSISRCSNTRKSTSCPSRSKCWPWQTSKSL